MTPMFRTGNAVKRYHTANLIVGETVGHHSANVALLCTVLADKATSVNLLMAALKHDLAEQFTGDVPAPTKWNHPKLKVLLDEIEDAYVHMPNLTQWETRVLKQADMLDLCFKAMEEVQMGNSPMKAILQRGITYLLDHAPLPNTLLLMEYFHEYK